jgi:hypothetical protein
VKTLMFVALCLALSSVFVSAQTPVSKGDVAKLISRVQQIPASQLDSALPRMAFEKWLHSQAGSDAAIHWLVRTADVPEQGFPWVEADVAIQGRPGIVIMVAVATKPTFHSLQLMRAGDYAEWPHLRDLPQALRLARVD